MSRVKAVIAGHGQVGCTGQGVDAFWKSVLEGKTGIVDGLGHCQVVQTEEGRAFEFAKLAIEEAFLDSNWKNDFSNTGLILATTTGYVSEWEGRIVEKEKEPSKTPAFLEAFKKEPTQALLNDLMSYFKFDGPSLVVSTACAAGTQALGIGALWLKQQKVKKCVVVGTESLSTLTVSGFGSFQLTSSGVCKPFDQNRSGINLSEGGAAICLEARKPRGNENIVTGCGFGCDAFSMTSPHPEGAGVSASIQSALKMANLDRNEISIVHAHGTGSIPNDKVESETFFRIFEDRVSVCSTKGIHGHALAASGVFESILCDLILKEQKFPGTYNLKDCEFDDFIQTSSELKELHQANHILKTTLGFGGTNAALIVSRGSVS